MIENVQGQKLGNLQDQDAHLQGQGANGMTEKTDFQKATVIVMTIKETIISVSGMPSEIKTMTHAVGVMMVNVMTEW
jgi:hypothetical protein